MDMRMCRPFRLSFGIGALRLIEMRILAERLLDEKHRPSNNESRGSQILPYMHSPFEKYL